jgi:hypothetical protein
VSAAWLPSSLSTTRSSCWTAGSDGFKVRLGRAYGENDIAGGRRWKMTAEQFAGFRTFIADAIAARDNGPGAAA